MKNTVMNAVKSIKSIYTLYFYIGTFFLKILKLFVRTDDKLILFVSYGGKKFDDSPKAIYNQMIKDSRFEGYKLVWAFHNPELHSIKSTNIIKIDTLEYYITALKARCWVTNSTIERGLEFKGRNTFYFNTWHGTPIKKMGIDISKDNKSFATKAKWKVDTMTAQSTYEADIFSRVFNIERDKFLISGLPRNDELLNNSSKEIKEIKERIGISLEKKIILYAPTYREYSKDANFNCVTDFSIDFKKWKASLGNEYVVILRAHYESISTIDLDMVKDFVIDASNYPNLNELMMISDVLISDYSSIFFDYAILNKPMYCFAYDYEEYSEKRGLYFDITKELPGGKISEDEFLEVFKNSDYKQVVLQVQSFREKYVESFGEATERALQKIYQEIK